MFVLVDTLALLVANHYVPCELRIIDAAGPLIFPACFVLPSDIFRNGHFSKPICIPRKSATQGVVV